MKNKLMEAKFKSPLGVAGQLFSRVACLGAGILICSSALAQNLFVTGGDAGGGKIFKFTWDGVQSIFASGLGAPQGLAFDSTGNLFVLDGGYIDGLGGAIYKFTPAGVRHTFVSAKRFCIGPGLAIDGADNLFTQDWCTGNIYKFTPRGHRSTFVSGLNESVSFLAF